MNWGNSIVLAFVLFAAFIGYMVVRAFQEDFDLVAEDYYAQEINYQQKLNQLSNAASDDKSVLVKQHGDEIRVTFPDAATGKIYFYHPSKKLFDRTFDIDLSATNEQVIAKSDLVPGNYRVNITWKSDAMDYHQKTTIYLQ